MSKKSRAISNTYDLRSSVFGVTSVSRKVVFPNGNTPFFLTSLPVVSQEQSFKELCSIVSYLKSAKQADELISHLDAICQEESHISRKYSCHCVMPHWKR